MTEHYVHSANVAEYNIRSMTSFCHFQALKKYENIKSHRKVASFLPCLIRVNPKTKVTRKQSMPNFLKNEHILSPDTLTYMCISGSKKCSFFGKFGYLRFEICPFALLPTRCFFLEFASNSTTLLFHHNMITYLVVITKLSKVVLN